MRRSATDRLTSHHRQYRPLPPTRPLVLVRVVRLRLAWPCPAARRRSTLSAVRTRKLQPLGRAGSLNPRFTKVLAFRLVITAMQRPSRAGLLWRATNTSASKPSNLQQGCLSGYRAVRTAQQHLGPDDLQHRSQQRCAVPVCRGDRHGRFQGCGISRGNSPEFRQSARHCGLRDRGWRRTGDDGRTAFGHCPQCDEVLNRRCAPVSNLAEIQVFEAGTP